MVEAHIDNNNLLYACYKVQILALRMEEDCQMEYIYFDFFPTKKKDDICCFIAKVTHNYKHG